MEGRQQLLRQYSIQSDANVEKRSTASNRVGMLRWTHIRFFVSVNREQTEMH